MLVCRGVLWVYKPEADSAAPQDVYMVNCEGEPALRRCAKMDEHCHVLLNND